MPIIYLDGVDGTGKSTLSRALEEQFGAKIIKTPPRDFFSERRPEIDRNAHSDIRACLEYYGSSVVYADGIARGMLEKNPDLLVVFDRSIYSTLATHIAMDGIYNRGRLSSHIRKEVDAYSKSLLKPDLIVFLYVEESSRLERIVRRSSSENTKSDADSDFAKLTSSQFAIIANDLRGAGLNVLELNTSCIDQEEIPLRVASNLQENIKISNGRLIVRNRQ
jgi:thymidylate kinase